MKGGGQLTDKLVFTAIYMAVAFLVVWAAGRMINYAVDTGFYRQFLIPWEASLLEMRYRTVRWPHYIRDNPMVYMQSVIKLMNANGVSLPKTNTRYRFIYRLNRFGNDNHQVLLVWHANTIVMYGLPPETFKRLDAFIDGQTDAGRGDFTGQMSKDQVTMIGSWKI